MTKKLQIQYVPWRSQYELLQVREWLFSSDLPQEPAFSSEPEVQFEIEGGQPDTRWQFRRKACDTVITHPQFQTLAAASQCSLARIAL